MEKKDRNQSLYNKVINVLKSPFFRTFANVFSHGGTHFVVMLVVLVAAVYYGFYNNQSNIIPQNIGLHIGWASVESPIVQDVYKGYIPKDSIDNVKVNVILNSKELELKTDGKYQNGIIVEFDGKSKNYAFMDTVSKKASTNFQDSVKISLYSEPRIKSWDVKAEYDPTIANHNNIHIEGDKIYKDSTWWEGKTKHVTTYVYTAPTDSKLQCDTISHDEYIDASLFPADYQAYYGQATRNYVCFYSNEIKPKNDSPYYYYYFNLPPAKNANIQSINFQISDPIIIDRFGMKYTQGKNLQYSYIFPEPDAVRNGMIEYNSAKKREEIRKNQGVIIQAVDVDELNKQNRRAFLYSVLIGTAFAFLLDIIVQLIRELRRLQRRKE